MTKWGLLALAAVFIPSVGKPGPFSYACEIESFQAPPGRYLSSEAERYWGELAMETPLNIDRDTGRVIHPIIGNENYFASDLTLLDRGSEGWSFVALAGGVFGPRIRYYEVMEYKDGLEKPFLAMADGVAYFGTCR